MLKIKSVGRICAVVLVVAMFLVSSTMVVSANMPPSPSPDVGNGDDSHLADDSPKPDALAGQSIAVPIFGVGNDFAPSMVSYVDRYAVIIVGGYNGTGADPEQYYKWFTDSAYRMYNILTNPTYEYGFLDENIYVLITEVEGYNWKHPEFGDNNMWIINRADYPATENNIKTVFDKFESNGEHELDDKDLLVVEVIGHGMDLGWWYGKKLGLGDICPNCHDTYFGLEKKQNNNKGDINFDENELENSFDTVDLSEIESAIEELSVDIGDTSIDQFLKNEVSNIEVRENCTKLITGRIPNAVFDWELAKYTSGINARRLVFILQPCFSGGFIKELSKNNRVIITSCKENEAAANFLGSGGFYSRLEEAADETISLAYAFEKAAEWVKGKYGEDFHPLLDDNGDKVGHKYDCCFYDPDTKGKDGYVADRIYNLKKEQPNISNTQSSQQYTTTTTTTIASTSTSTSSKSTTTTTVTTTGTSQSSSTTGQQGVQDI